MANISSSNSLGERVPKLRFPGFEGGWEEKCFSDLADGFEYGMNSAACEFDGLNRYIRITDIDDNTHEYIDSCPVSPDGEMNEKYIVKEHDILFARTGASTGKTYLYNKKDGILYFAGFLIRANINAFNDSYFVFNLTLTNKYNNWVKLMSMRSGQPGINAMEYSTYKVFVPQIAEQHKIASFLQLLDKKIKLQRQLIEFLKLYKRGLLSKLFPQKGESVPQYRFTEFTDAWEQRKLGELAEIVGGGTPSTSVDSYWDGDIDWYAPAEIGEQIYLESSQRKITEEGLTKSSAKILPIGTVLFTSRAGIGKTAILLKEGCTNQGFQSIVPNKEKLDSYFIFTRSEELKRYGETVGAGSTFVEVSGKQMANMELMMPKTMPEQQQIGEYFANLDHLITLHQRKQDFCEKVKLALLQQMFI